MDEVRRTDSMYEQGQLVSPPRGHRQKRPRDKLDWNHMISYHPIFVFVRSSAYAFQIKMLGLLIEQMRLHIPLTIGDPLGRENWARSLHREGSLMTRLPVVGCSFSSSLLGTLNRVFPYAPSVLQSFNT